MYLQYNGVQLSSETCSFCLSISLHIKNTIIFTEQGNGCFVNTFLVLYKLCVSEEEEEKIWMCILVQDCPFASHWENKFVFYLQRGKGKGKYIWHILGQWWPLVSNIFYQSKRRHKGKKMFLLSKLTGKILQNLGRIKPVNN